MTDALFSALQVQSHLLRATKFRDGRTRNWSLFFFFRVLTQAEVDAPFKRGVTKGATAAQGAVLEVDFANTALASAGVVEQSRFEMERAGRSEAAAMPDAPAQAFREWLKVLVDAKGEGFAKIAQEFAAQLWPLKSRLRGVPDGGGLDLLSGGFSAFGINGQLGAKLGALLQDRLAFLDDPDAYLHTLMTFGVDHSTAGSHAIKHGLLGLVIYEALRQAAPAYADVGAPSVVRGEAADGVDAMAVETFDPAPINICFTYPGLESLKFHEATLASFPEAFRQGMAARAAYLGDTGPSAPEHWEGKLGLRTVHGFFTGGFLLSDSLDEDYWRAVRNDVRSFNEPTTPRGQALRAAINLLFRCMGMEIVHIELGQDPYEVENGRMKPQPHRVEHFGFRDGLSQPFVDMRLGDTPAGGGTPRRSGTWAPVAPGEIFLDQPDEAGMPHLQPLSDVLRRGSTFIVFRKLEQDVAGFRAYLARQRPDDKRAQDVLAAQFVGRWKNGTPLALSPHGELDAGPGAEAWFNDFRYVTHDPQGRKCPLGAHVRRANPRDIGGRDGVRRHRILRRGVSYGGPLLPEDSIGDGEKRGLLFIAANARIDTQFEVIQAEWLNQGELLGQAGLGRCPLAGANGGGPQDAFLEAGAAAPVTELPRFVLTRGGDYFFAPGVEALRKIASDPFPLFPVGEEEMPFYGHGMGDYPTPSLFDEGRLGEYAKEFVLRKESAVYLQAPPPSSEVFVFIGRHAHARQLLDGRPEFTVKHYREASERFTRGRVLLVGTDIGDPERQRLTKVLDKAWETLKEGWSKTGRRNPAEHIRNVAKARLEMALRRTSTTRRVDLVHDLAATATYGVVSDVYGVPGPTWLTELAVALPFSRQHLGDLHRDWFAALKGEAPEDPAFTTMQVWSALILADLIGNVQSQSALHVLSQQAAAELLSHLDMLLAQARATRGAGPPRTLLEAFVDIEPWYRDEGYREFRSDVTALLLELVGTTLATTPLTFGAVMTTLFNFRIDLPRLMPDLAEPQPPGQPSGYERLIYEAERFNPGMKIRMRYCAKDIVLGEAGEPDPSDAPIAAGQWVAALMPAVNLDCEAFPQPHVFSLNPLRRFQAWPVRNVENYMPFGVLNSPRACWGREKIAMVVLEECVKAAGRLHGLRRVAGPRGEVKRLVGVTIGLPARFVQVG
jgi:Dyp-type peroxidase family